MKWLLHEEWAYEGRRNIYLTVVVREIKPRALWKHPLQKDKQKSIGKDHMNEVVQILQWTEQDSIAVRKRDITGHA